MTTHHLNLFFFPSTAFLTENITFLPDGCGRRGRQSSLRDIFTALQILICLLSDWRVGEDAVCQKMTGATTSAASSPLSLLFSLDKESSFCLSDFLCLWPSIEDIRKQQFIASHTVFWWGWVIGEDICHIKQHFSLFLRVLLLGMAMWQPMSRSRSSLLKATSCRRHRSSSDRLCSGTGFRPMLRPDTLFQVKSPWGHTDADTQHSSLSPRRRFTSNHTLHRLKYQHESSGAPRDESWQLTLGGIWGTLRFHNLRLLGLNRCASGNCVSKEQKIVIRKIKVAEYAHNVLYELDSMVKISVWT